jgi:hypothetical protein
MALQRIGRCGIASDLCRDATHEGGAVGKVNKSDRNDARGIAHMMRVGLYRPVHVKTLGSQKRRMLLTSRTLLQAKAIDIESDLRGTLRNFGLKVGMVGVAKFEARIRELVADHPDLATIAEPLLIARRVLREQLGVLHRLPLCAASPKKISALSRCARALILGYFFLSHCSTRASSRSCARCRGFWQVMPSCASSRPTELALNRTPNLFLISLATMSRVHSAKANFSCNGFFFVMVL